MRELKREADKFAEKSFAAKGLRASDIPEIVEKPAEGLRPGLGRNVNTGKIFNAARNLTDKVARPLMRGAVVIDTLRNLAMYAEEQKVAKKSTLPRDISGGPDAELSAKGSPVVKKLKLPDDPADVKRAKSDYDKWKLSQKAVTAGKAPEGAKAPKKYRHDLTKEESNTIRNQAIADMKKRADSGDVFWKGQLAKALRK